MSNLTEYPILCIILAQVLPGISPRINNCFKIVIFRFSIPVAVNVNSIIVTKKYQLSRTSP
jgi:hypothetical protein